MNMEWLEKSKNYRCVNCDFVTKNKLELKWHLDDHHNTEKTEQLQHKCPVSDGFTVG
jgi:hypothetical protein